MIRYLLTGPYTATRGFTDVGALNAFTNAYADPDYWVEEMNICVIWVLTDGITFSFRDCSWNRERKQWVT